MNGPRENRNHMILKQSLGPARSDWFPEKWLLPLSCNSSGKTCLDWRSGKYQILVGGKYQILGGGKYEILAVANIKYLLVANMKYFFVDLGNCDATFLCNILNQAIEGKSVFAAMTTRRLCSYHVDTRMQLVE